MDNPVKELLAFAAEWWSHYERQDFAWLEAQHPASLADLVAKVDKALTGHERAASSRASDLLNASNALFGDSWSVHLSDGGWSRLNFDLSRVVGGDGVGIELSLERVCVEWNRLSGAEA